MDRLRYYLQIIDWKFVGALVLLAIVVKIILTFA